MATKIEWADETWNPVTGCTPISPGCKNCYAQRMARRLAGRHGYPEAPYHFDVTLHPDRLDQPLKWKKPRMIFVCSMSDLFHDDVPDDFIISVFARMTALREHSFQLLTKRPERMRDFVMRRVPGIGAWDNIWFGVTAENQAAANERIPPLLQIPAVRFVSVEPMLGSVYLIPYLPEYDYRPTHEYYRALYPGMGDQPVKLRDGLDQVICGAETGPGKRPMKLDWARSIRDQCQEANVPFFFKCDSKGSRKLDGRLWEELPR